MSERKNKATPTINFDHGAEELHIYPDQLDHDLTIVIHRKDA